MRKFITMLLFCAGALAFSTSCNDDFTEINTPSATMNTRAGEQRAESLILMKDGRMWQEDYEGNIVHPFMHEWSDILRYPAEADDGYSTEYHMSDYSKYQISQKYGILNRHTGKPLTPAIYESIDMISPTIFEVRPANNYGLLLIDINGNAVKE